MSRSPTDDTAHQLGKSMGSGPIAKESAPREDELKRRGDQLQNLVDKATGGKTKPH